MEKQNILKDNFINYKDVQQIDMDILSIEDNVFFFDTESCPDLPAEIVDQYDLTNKEISDIPEFQETKEGSLLWKLQRSKQLKAQVYVWQFGCNNSDRVYWGNTIDQFIEFCQAIDLYKIEKGFKVEPFTIYVHNLAWDIEFFKYWFKEHEFKQIRVSEEKSIIASNKKLENHFNITETDGTCYNAVIQLEKRTATKKGTNRKVNYLTTLNFLDSYKITPKSLEAISKDVIQVDQIYIKTKEDMKYDLVRDPKTYRPSPEESWYIYCDIYLLKEWYNQLVLGFYMNDLGVDAYTISQIAFDSILKMTYADDILRNKYGAGRKKPLTDRQVYEQHFELKWIEKNTAHSEYFRTAYKGGHTTASTKYTNIAKNNNETIEGVSMDITSSYPTQMSYKPLPYGRPSRIMCGKYKDSYDDVRGVKRDFHFITIAFDGWNSKNKNNQFGLNLKISQLTDYEKKVLNWTPNESYPDNIVDGVYVGTNRIEVKDPKRKKRIEKVKHNFVVTLTHHEYEEWIKNFNFIRYVNGKKVDGVHFIDYVSLPSEVGHFKKGLDYFFKMKAENDGPDGNKTKKEMSKLIINSFYGKHCSRREREQKFYNFNKDIICFQEVTEENENEWLDKKMYAVHYGAGVTSHGRIQLRETCRKIGSDKFIYADTDSLKFEMNYEDLKTIAVKENINITGVTTEQKALGDWDYEFSFEDFKAVGQKKYMYKKDGSDWTCKCAGLPKNIRDTIKDKSQFAIGKVFTKKAQKKVIGGKLMLYTEYSISDLTRF